MQNNANTNRKRVAFKVAAESVVLGMVLGVMTVPLKPAQSASVGASVDFSTGTYDSWDGSSYDFSWYTPGQDSYTINSAAQLAALSILTNDLSAGQSGEWDDIKNDVITCVTAGITDPDELLAATDVANGYIAEAEDFSGATITLAADIDLGDHDWLPISYPWRTASLSSTYSFRNTDGDMVKYNAVDHIPELETVDDWVGDENGDPISTRYWELPESEMRFRDLVETLTFSKMNDYYITTGSAGEADSKRIELGDLAASVKKLEEHDYYEATNKIIEYYIETDEYEKVYFKAGSQKDFYAENFLRSYSYKNIKGFTETKGFSGTFDGDDHKIKGLKPETPWTDDYEARLRTYDPLGKGLFSMIGENGTVKDLNVKGEINGEIYSYSGFLCAYNYGTVDNCYVEGDMAQGLIDMVFPVARDYSPNHNSTYKLSNESYFTDVPAHGTVMPVGNSGFMSAVNYGTIRNSTTTGSVTQAFRQFGFFAAINYGTISGCENYGDVESQDVTTDFTTDEWSYDLTQHHALLDSYEHVWNVGPQGMSHIQIIESPNYSVETTEFEFKGLWDDAFANTGTAGFIQADSLIDTPAGKDAPMGIWRLKGGSMTSGFSLDAITRSADPAENNFLSYLKKIAGQTRRYINRRMFTDPTYGTSNYIAFKTASPLIKQGNGVAITSKDDAVWMPALYNTNVGESVAANHLYGVYSLTVVGGICADNRGTINNCINDGDITELGNTSGRTAYAMESDTTKRASLNYIRPNNQYALFSTAIGTANYAGGIAGLNFGTISGGENSGTVFKRNLSAYEEFRNNVTTVTAGDYVIGGVNHSRTYTWIETDDIEELANPYTYCSYIGCACNGKTKAAAQTLLSTDTFIPYTANGFYVTNGMYNDGGTLKPNPFAVNWWVTQNIKDNAATMASKLTTLLATVDTSDTNAWREELSKLGMKTDLYLQWEENGVIYDYIFQDTEEKALVVSLCSDITPLIQALITSYNNIANTTLPSDDAMMPYPHVTPRIGKNTQVTGGITAMNANLIDGATNTGTADNGICQTSRTINDTKAQILNCTQDSDTTVISNICNLALDSDIIGCVSSGIIGTDADNLNEIGGIANFAYSQNLPILLDKNVVNYGRGQFNKVGGGTKGATLSNSIIYDDSQLAEGFTDYASNTFFKNVYNFQPSKCGVSEMGGSSKVEDAYVYSDCTYGVGAGRAQYVKRFFYYGMNCDYIISENSSTFICPLYEDMTVFMMRADGSHGQTKYGLIDGRDFTIKDAWLFFDYKQHVAKWNNVTVDNLLFYGDSEDMPTGAKTYSFELSNCNCKDMILEMNIHYEYKDFLTTGKIEDVPGALKAYNDTNTFDHCVIQVPMGVVTYVSKSFIDEGDDTIRTDCRLDYDVNARVSGSLAYLLDRGYTKNRTYNYSVAHDDELNFAGQAKLSIDWSAVSDDFSTAAVPAYTRKIKSGETLKPYYAFNVPFTGEGAGEVVATVTRDSETYSTKATDEIFPKTTIYVHEGETVDLTTIALAGHELLGMTRSTKDGSVKIKSDLPSTEPFKHEHEIIGDSDVELICEWALTHAIEVDETYSTDIDLRASAASAIVGRPIRVSAISLNSDFEVGRVYYCLYKKDKNNLYKLDLSDQREIPLETMEFEMPDYDIRIFVEPFNTGNEITKFVIGGERGRIDSVNNRIDVVLEVDIDVTALAPSEIRVSEGATVTPGIGVPQDFSNPVIYTVTSESGVDKKYSVYVKTKKDGYITQFEALGYLGEIKEIDDDHGEILFEIPDVNDITNVTPTIIWHGAGINPAIGAAQDFTNPVTYTITSVDGSVARTYTVKFTLVPDALIVRDLSLTSSDGTELTVEIDEVDKKIYVTGPYGVNFAHVNIDLLKFFGDNINIENNQELNLTVASSVVITDNAGASVIYDFVVRELPSDFKVIKQFMMSHVYATIDQTAETITLHVPSNVDITNLKPTFVVWEGKTLTDITVPQDFTNPVVYTVTAYDGTSKSYTVTVTQ